jgi:hypothetical protein
MRRSGDDRRQSNAGPSGVDMRRDDVAGLGVSWSRPGRAGDPAVGGRGGEGPAADRAPPAERLLSPNGRIEVVARSAARFSCDVLFDGKTLLRGATPSLDVVDEL